MLPEHPLACFWVLHSNSLGLKLSQPAAPDYICMVQ